MDNKPIQASDFPALLKQSPFIALLGIEFVSWDEAEQKLQLKMPCKPQLERAAQSGQMHGGVIASFLDTATTLAVVAALGRPVPTVDLRIDYLRPAGGPFLRASATVRRLGSKLATADGECVDEAGRVLALCRGTFLV